MYPKERGEMNVLRGVANKQASDSVGCSASGERGKRKTYASLILGGSLDCWGIIIVATNLLFFIGREKGDINRRELAIAYVLPTQTANCLHANLSGNEWVLRLAQLGVTVEEIQQTSKVFQLL